MSNNNIIAAIFKMFEEQSTATVIEDALYVADDTDHVLIVRDPHNISAGYGKVVLEYTDPNGEQRLASIYQKTWDKIEELRISYVI